MSKTHNNTLPKSRHKCLNRDLCINLELLHPFSFIPKTESPSLIVRYIRPSKRANIYRFLVNSTCFSIYSVQLGDDPRLVHLLRKACFLRYSPLTFVKESDYFPQIRKR